MADNIRVSRVGGTEMDEVLSTPADPDAAREQIEATRARISGTIDEIEDALLLKKEKIQDRLDVLAPVRDRPIPALGILFGAGLVLGVLTGGGDDSDDNEIIRTRSRADIWEERANRLLRIAQDQESELESLKSERRSLRARNRDDDDDDEGTSALDRVRDFVSERLAGAVVDSFQRITRRMGR